MEKEKVKIKRLRTIAWGLRIAWSIDKYTMFIIVIFIISFAFTGQTRHDRTKDFQDERMIEYYAKFSENHGMAKETRIFENTEEIVNQRRKPYERHRSFADITGSRTTILISHRLGITQLVDRILVFNDGRIVEDGTHSELLDRGGLYANMYRAQAHWYE